jgi:hypothetical protein
VKQKVTNLSPISFGPSRWISQIIASPLTAGVLLLREAEFKLTLTSSIAAQMSDTRNHAATRYQLGDLLRERVNALAWAIRHKIMSIVWHMIQHFE